jgi:hypothetical protein
MQARIMPFLSASGYIESVLAVKESHLANAVANIKSINKSNVPTQKQHILRKEIINKRINIFRMTIKITIQNQCT